MQGCQRYLDKDTTDAKKRERENERMKKGTNRKTSNGLGSKLHGSLQVDDLRLAQHLCELDSPLRADVVAEETAKDAWVRKVREQACHGALTGRRALGTAAYLSEVTLLPLFPSHSLLMPSVV